ncbi:protein of unknown function [Methylacidimicrobium sp. AP8]|nr:protein of unknown function [Methylacidimicrobium sp. AP8]
MLDQPADRSGPGGRGLLPGSGVGHLRRAPLGSARKAPDGGCLDLQAALLERASSPLRGPLLLERCREPRHRGEQGGRRAPAPSGPLGPGGAQGRHRRLRPGSGRARASRHTGAGLLGDRGRPPEGPGGAASTPRGPDRPAGPPGSQGAPMTTAWIDPLRELLRSHPRVVLVTVTGVRGHAPQSVGAKMVVTEEESVGTVGGGNLEMTALAEARKMLASREEIPRSIVVRLGAGKGSGAPNAAAGRSPSSSSRSRGTCRKWRSSGWVMWAGRSRRCSRFCRSSSFSSIPGPRCCFPAGFRLSMPPRTSTSARGRSPRSGSPPWRRELAW